MEFDFQSLNLRRKSWRRILDLVLKTQKANRRPAGQCPVAQAQTLGIQVIDLNQCLGNKLVMLSELGDN